MQTAKQHAFTLKDPKDAFPKCPHCLSARMGSLGESDVYCKDCHWNSSKLYAELLVDLGRVGLFQQ